MLDLVSIIVPVFNGEKTIKRCLNSLLNQTYSHIEVIIINDGSVDKTEDIIKSINDKRICYYSQKNQGVSYTRNMGISLSKGNFICFVDADDYVDKNYIESLLKEKECNTLVACGVKRIKNKEVDIYENRNVTYLSKLQLLKDFDVNFNRGLFHTIYAKLYEKKLIEKMFDIEIQYGEDLLFNLNYFKNINKFKIINNTFYEYYLDNNYLSVKLHENELHAIKEMQMHLMNFIGSDKNAKLTVDLFLSNNLMAYLQKIMFDNSILNKKEKVNEILIIYKNFKLENENKELKKLLNKEYLYMKIYFKIKKLYKK